MFNKKCGLVLLTLLLLLVSVSGVCATDNNTDSLTTVEDNDSVYGCGVVAFQKALKYNEVNITLEEAKKAINTVNGSTSMQGLIDGAEKYNLSAVGVVIKAEDLKTGYIVHMNIDNIGHWAVIENITDQVNLNDIYDDVILPLGEFKKYYTNKTVIISKKPINDVNCSMLTVNECKELFGRKYAYSYIKKVHYIPANTNPGYAFQIKIVVPKWGGDIIRVTTTKLTPHMICCKVVYKITHYKQYHYKGKPFTNHYACFFNLAMKKGKSFTANIPAKGVKSLKFTWTVSRFP